MSTTNILDLNNRIDALEKFAHNVEPIQQQIDELKAWSDSGTKDASGNPIILTDGAAFNAVDLKVSLEPKQSGSGTPSPSNVRPITGYTECVVEVKDEDETTQDTATITFGQTVYGGSVDFKKGKVTVTHAIADLGTLNYTAQTNISSFYAQLSDAVTGATGNVMNAICSQYNAVQTKGSVADTMSQGDGIFAMQNRSKLLFIKDTSKADLTASQFADAMNGVQLCYELATPIELTLTHADLELLKGYNYITTNGTTIDLTYQPDNLKANILLTVSQLYGSKISIFDEILAGGDTGQVLTKTSDDNYDATWATLPTTRTANKK